MRKFLISLLLSAAAIAPAHATQAKWKDMERWSVVGDPAVPYCSTYAYFPGVEKAVHITLNTEGWAISVQGVNVVAGSKYTSRFGTTRKAGILTGIAINNSTVKFPFLSLDTVKQFALTPYISVGGVGKFSMTGSMEAILETINCYRAITEIRSSVAPAAPAAVPVYEREI